MTLTYQPTHPTTECIDRIVNTLKQKQFNCENKTVTKKNIEVNMIFIRVPETIKAHEIINISVMVSKLDY